ncbi:hypothetical protein [Streptomyces luteireticuli]
MILGFLMLLLGIPSPAELWTQLQDSGLSSGHPPIALLRLGLR